MFVLALGPVGIWNWLAFVYPGFLGLRDISQGLQLEQVGGWCPILTYSSEGSGGLLLLTPNPTWVIWAIRESLFVFVFTVTRSKQIPFHAPTLCMMNGLLQGGSFVFLFSLFFKFFFKHPQKNSHSRENLILQWKRGGPAKVNMLAQKGQNRLMNDLIMMLWT